jgi:hypothetical protein
MLTCFHRGALKTRYDASKTLGKTIKSNVAGTSLMKAIRCWIKDPSQLPTVKVGILHTQNDANRAIETQTEIGSLHNMFRGFVSIDWGHVNMEADVIPNLSKNIHTYLNQVRKAIKSRPSPEARSVSANAYCENGNTGSLRLNLLLLSGKAEMLYYMQNLTTLN